jgi:hypothetical protein
LQSTVGTDSGDGAGLRAPAPVEGLVIAGTLSPAEGEGDEPAVGTLPAVLVELQAATSISAARASDRLISVCQT